MKNPVVPLNERFLNGVDPLNAQIDSFQTNCCHDFRLLRENRLQESDVKGVFIAVDRLYPNRSFEFFNVRCMYCSKEKDIWWGEICPFCLEKLEKTIILEDRKKYFGINHWEFSARLYKCSSCIARFVSDEWVLTK